MWWLYILLCAFCGNYYNYLYLFILMKKFLFSVNVYAFIMMMLFIVKNRVFILVLMHGYIFL